MTLNEIKAQILDTLEENEDKELHDKVNYILDNFGNNELIRGKVYTNKLLFAMEYQGKMLSQYCLKNERDVYIFNSGCVNVLTKEKETEFKATDLEYENSYYFLLDRVLNTRYNKIKYKLSSSNTTWCNRS
jgi:hypothetical protein